MSDTKSKGSGSGGGLFSGIVENGKALLLLGLFAGLITLGAYGCASLDPDDLTKVAVPEGVRAPGQPKTITLREARVDFDKKAAAMQADLALYADLIVDGEERAAALAGLVEWLQSRVGIAGEAAIPGWGALGGTAALSGLFGWLGFRRPGDVKRDDATRDRDQNYDAGASETLSRTLATLGAISVQNRSNPNA